MKAHVLVDNNTLIDKYYLAEPGFCVLLEDDDCRILFDTGYSDIFIRNSQKMGLDLSCLDYIVFSHSHLDHTWGIDPLIRHYSERRASGLACATPTVVAHSQTFVSVVEENFGEFGSLLSQKKIAKHFPLQLNPTNIVPGIGFSPDKMLQGRIFSYGDAQRYRLGVNHHLIPVNKARCPKRNKDPAYIQLPES